MSVIAKQLGVSASAAYLWLKAGTPAGAPAFARVTPSRARSLRAEVAGATLIVESGFDAELLRQVVAALSGSS